MTVEAWPVNLALHQIARVAHEANRAYCIALGDYSQPAWADAPEWQRSSAIDGVEAIHAGKVKTPADSHANWYAEKAKAGWRYGPVKDAEKKEHPCFVPYAELPSAQKLKDALFFNIVTTLLRG